MTRKILLRPPNTDGIGNCLQQPRQLSNQLHKSMRSKLFSLIKLSVPWLILQPRQSQ